MLFTSKNFNSSEMKDIKFDDTQSEQLKTNTDDKIELESTDLNQLNDMFVAVKSNYARESESD